MFVSNRWIFFILWDAAAAKLYPWSGAPIINLPRVVVLRHDPDAARPAPRSLLHVFSWTCLGLVLVIYQ